MKQYLKLMKLVRKNGTLKQNRTNVDTLSIFGYQMKFNLENGFPLVTTKCCNFRSIVYELLWFVQGSTNIDFLKMHNVHIWDMWADKYGNLGPIYGKQWRFWQGYNGNKIDQLSELTNTIKNDPNSRRMVISSWNVGDLNQMSLPPCHVLFQFNVTNKILSCQLYQRSCDVFIGLPFNIASYALLMHMIANQCNLKVGNLIWTGGDIHIYTNHLKQVDLQLTRHPKSLPKLIIKSQPTSLFDYSFEDFKLIGYYPYSPIKAKVVY